MKVPSSFGWTGVRNPGILPGMDTLVEHTFRDASHIALLRVDGDEHDIVAAARVSYASESTPKGDRRLIDYLIRHRHDSPLEFPVLTFHVTAPIFVARQWFRHRIGSFNEASARYRVLDEGSWDPVMWRGQGDGNKQASGAPFTGEDAKLAELTYRVSVLASRDSYQKLLNLGVSREMARSVLPVATMTEFYWRVNLRSLLHFILLRDSEHAQPEIAQFAEWIRYRLGVAFPNVMRSWDRHVFTAVNLSVDAQTMVHDALYGGNPYDSDAYRSAPKSRQKELEHVLAERIGWHYEDEVTPLTSTRDDGMIEDSNTRGDS